MGGQISRSVPHSSISKTNTFALHCRLSSVTHNNKKTLYSPTHVWLCSAHPALHSTHKCWTEHTVHTSGQLCTREANNTQNQASSFIFSLHRPCQARKERKLRIMSMFTVSPALDRSHLWSPAPVYK